MTDEKSQIEQDIPHSPEQHRKKRRKMEKNTKKLIIVILLFSSVIIAGWSFEYYSYHNARTAPGPEYIIVHANVTHSDNRRNWTIELYSPSENITYSDVYIEILRGGITQEYYIGSTQYGINPDNISITGDLPQNKSIQFVPGNKENDHFGTNDILYLNSTGEKYWKHAVVRINYIPGNKVVMFEIRHPLSGSQINISSF